jgi:hypothetical protein
MMATRSGKATPPHHTSQPISQKQRKSAITFELMV